MGKLISVCEKKNCNYVFIVDRRLMKKPRDDPRIRHLQDDHNMKEQTTLENYFTTIEHEANTLNLFVVAS